MRFHKRSVDRSGKCALFSGDSSVYVAVYEMGEAGKEILDKIEGVGKGYLAGSIDVAGFGQCETYFADPEYVDEDLEPYDWYHELVLLGCRHLDFPKDYIAGVERTAAIPDPDANRSDLNRQLIERLIKQA